MKDIEHHIALLENHDEQRLASPNLLVHQKRKTFDGCFHNNKLSSPPMIYFGQEVGEAGNENGGFGTHSRTSILIM
jgi:hypothetical protein